MDKTSENKIWYQFLDWIERHSENWYYRGVSDTNHLLKPSVGRDSYTLDDELNLFELFKLKSNLHFSKNNYNEYEWLALAQHHGLPTRLLDWTNNPLVAVFFSVISNKDTDGRIYAVNPEKFINVTENKSPFSIKQIEFLQPPISTNRIELQKGIFSIHPLPNKSCIITSTIDNDGVADNYSSFLTETEYAENYFRDYPPYFDFEKFNISKCVKEEDREDYMIRYQENYYKNFGNDIFYFDIPKEYKSSFEKKIRRLGIDELIFGDVDSIADQLKYLKANKSLNKTTMPNIETSLPFLQDYINRGIVDFFKKGESGLPLDLEYSLYGNNFSFSLKEIKHFAVNRIVLSGRIESRIHSKLDIEGDQVFYDFNKIDAKAQKITGFLRGIDKKYYPSWPLVQEVEIELSNGSYSLDESVISIRKIEFLTSVWNTKGIRKEIKDVDTQLGKSKFSIIEKSDVEKILILDQDSEEYKELLKKYLNL